MRNRHPFRVAAADRRLTAPAAIVGAWAVVALAAAVQAVALVRLDGRADMAGAVLNRVSIIPLWALATPLILRSARRYPVVDGPSKISLSSMALHAVLASLFIVVTNVLIRLPVAFAPVADGGGVAVLVRSTMQGVAEYYPPAMVVYGVVVAIGHALFGAPPADAAPTDVTLGSNGDAANGHTVNGGPSNGPADARMEDPDTRLDTRLDASPSAVAATDGLDGHITVRQWNRVHLVRIEDIDFVEAEDNYVVVHAASRTYKGRDRISDVESQLDARRFVRIHRSTIVHLAKIREVQPLTHGDYAVILRDGKVLRVARSRRQALGQALGVPL
jgi:hypothetical protein